jgi:hypothetical protein
MWCKINAFLFEAIFSFWVINGENVTESVVLGEVTIFDPKKLSKIPQQFQ